jgi:LPS sulfotransferase NodH
MKPRVSYVICAVQRSGTKLLSEALQNTGLAGNSQEYFLCSENGRWEDPDGWWARTYGIQSRREYLDQVFRLGTTPNGVFGVTIMWNYFPLVLRNLRELDEYQGMTAPEVMNRLLVNPKYIWLARRDKIRQAVSWAKAGQTGIYHVRLGETPTPAREPQFDFTFISNLYRLILEGEKGWRDFFAEAGVRPLEIVYEELVEAYEMTARKVLDYLRIPYPQDLIFGERRLLKQADAVNEDWVQRYMREKLWVNSKSDN